MDEGHRRHIYEGEPDEDLIDALEPDQLDDAMNAPLPRRRLGPWARAGLWALRVFVLGVTALVAYAFVVSIVRGG
ncbi:MAG TPA: hypothetical protein VIA06_14950 [Candidatus Dormibacteraeota bacterium]|nr:hypothetical protein [Candidatus Dormibacteraeota bacterium]